jgi:hypothetical protein
MIERSAVEIAGDVATESIETTASVMTGGGVTGTGTGDGRATGKRRRLAHRDSMMISSLRSLGEQIFAKYKINLKLLAMRTF